MTSVETHMETRAGEFVVLRIEDLRIDHLYQRDLILEVVEKIAAEWDIATAGAILVSQRENGEMYVIDGQHRLAAAKKAGETEILTQVLTGMTPEQEAARRLRGNYKRTDRIYEAFRARVFAGDPVAVGIQSLLGEFGTHANYSPTLHTGINAIATVEWLWKRDGTGAYLREVLTLIRDTFEDVPEAERASVGILRSFAWFRDRHLGEADIERFKERTRATGVRALDRMARNQRAAMGGTLWLNYYRALVESYNYRLSSNQLEWRTTGATGGRRGGSWGGGNEGGGPGQGGS